MTGILIPPSNPSAFAEALHRLINDKQLRRSMAYEGKKTVKENFGLDKMIKGYQKIYESYLFWLRIE